MKKLLRFGKKERDSLDGYPFCNSVGNVSLITCRDL